MLQNNFEIRVLIKGRPINEYPHNGQTFVEGRAGSQFEIEFFNRTNTRVETVISVDGLSIIDGKEASPSSSGYIVDAYGSIRIPGWKLSDEQVAAFIFAGKTKSYATQMTGSSNNNGVIGALVFSEKQAVLQYATTTSSVSLKQVLNNIHIPTATWNIPSNAVYGSGSLGSGAIASSASKGVMRGMSPGVSVTEVDRSLVEPSLGTGFGQATEFATTTVNFVRADLLSMIVLYYDDAKNLRKRGIELSRPSRQHIAKNNQPQAFPGMNCSPPPNWKG